jgi:hypothetical protein
MKPRASDHVHFRQLISARLDGPLSVIAERQLLRHLARCADCRTVYNDYNEQRRRLRELPVAPPPRDMWARTSAALDRELARRPRGTTADERRRAPGSTMIVAAAALGVALVVGTAQLNVVPPPPDDGLSASPRPPLPTPFGVMPQRISFLGADANGLVLFRGQVDQVCPPAALGCIDDDDLSPQVIPYGHSVVPVSVSVSPDGELVAVTGRRDGRDGILALVPTEPVRPPELSPAPAPSVSPDPPPSAEPPAPRQPVEPGPATPPPPAATPLPDALHTPTASVEPEPVASVAPAPALAAVAVMEDVQVAGAPPAWSADGTLLAFSAMPADRSHGPDIYLWRVGADSVEALTSDHASYFASWAGERIVASRILPPVAEDSPPAIVTVVIDIASGEERTLVADGLWLPVIGPLAQRAVVWHGELEVGPTAVRPLHGALYLTDWTALDPFAEVRLESDENTQGRPSPAAEPSPTAGVESPTIRPGPGQRPMLTLPPDDQSPAPSPVESVAGDTQPEEAPDEPAPIALLPIELGRDPLLDPVLDWQVRWSADGRTLGYWIADVPGASWGRLAVIDVDELAADPETAQPRLPAVLARRHFTLGIDRVVWIAPTDAQPEGEVRIRTWGPAGEGGRRIPSLDLREVVPAF